VRKMDKAAKAAAAEMERDKNRKNLQHIMSDYEKFKGEMSTFQASMSAMKGEFQQMMKLHVQQEIMTIDSGLREVQRQMQESARSTKSQQQEVATMKSDMQQFKSMQGDMQQLKSMQGDMQQLKSMQGDMQQLKSMQGDIQSIKSTAQEIQSMKRELDKVSQQEKEKEKKLQQQSTKSQEHQRQIDDLKKGMQSSDKLTSLQAKADLTAVEFNSLKKMIYDRGLLAPKVEMPADPEEPPPVGTVALGEDVFTARLLVHLGMLTSLKNAKAAAEGGDQALLDLDNEYSDESDEVDKYDGDIPIDDENVHGISEVEFHNGSLGHWYITAGWLAICISVFLLQILVVLILIQGAKDAGDGCFEHHMERYTYNWWLLHASKSVAIGTAGILMGQEIMDCLNYAMVSVLVEPHINYEVCFVTFSRMALSALIAYANVVIFGYLKFPATVWINMTALAFIGELGTGMLDVARRGVFGHNIMKTMTGLNFELTFVSEYPSWFPAVRFTAMFVACCFVGVFASMAFVAPDRDCHSGFNATNVTHLIHMGMAHHEHGGGGAVGGAHGHHR